MWNIDEQSTRYEDYPFKVIKFENNNDYSYYSNYINNLVDQSKNNSRT